MSTVNLVSKFSRDNERKWWYFEYGRGAGQRIAAGVFTYVKPKSVLEKNHNKSILGKLETEKAARILDLSNGIAPHLANNKLHKNLLDFYEEWVNENKLTNSRHVEGSLRVFKDFLREKLNKTDKEIFLLAGEVTEDVCEKFRNWLAKKFTGETPVNYFSRFKRMMKKATKLGYFRVDPCDDVKGKKGKENESKDVLTVEEITYLSKFPCRNPEVKKAFMFSFFTGIRGQSVRGLQWSDIRDSQDGPYISILQNKTHSRVDVPILKEALAFLPHERDGDEEKVFKLPTTTNGYNKVLKQWIKDAGINKHITGHCARHSLGTALKSGNVSDLLIADVLGHTTTQLVGKYSRMSELSKKREGIKAAITLKSDRQP